MLLAILVVVVNLDWAGGKSVARILQLLPLEFFVAWVVEFIQAVLARYLASTLWSLLQSRVCYLDPPRASTVSFVTLLAPLLGCSNRAAVHFVFDLVRFGCHALRLTSAVHCHHCTLRRVHTDRLLPCLRLQTLSLLHRILDLFVELSFHLVLPLLNAGHRHLGEFEVVSAARLAVVVVVLRQTPERLRLSQGAVEV